MLSESCSQTTMLYLVIKSSCWLINQCPVKEVETEMKQEKGGERRKEEEANGRGAATGVLVHGLVTQE